MGTGESVSRYSDDAQTPEEFFGLHPITKAPLYDQEAELLDVLDDDRNVFERLDDWVMDLNPKQFWAFATCWLSGALILIFIGLSFAAGLI